MGVVLVVEDNSLVTDAMRVLLEATGFTVVTASTVSEAVTRCEESRPALMLLDLSLPDGNGLEALAQLTESGCAPRITVALTGNDDPSVRQLCLDSGCREVLIKPVAARDLMTLVSGWMMEAMENIPAS